MRSRQSRLEGEDYAAANYKVGLAEGQARRATSGEKFNDELLRQGEARGLMRASRACSATAEYAAKVSKRRSGVASEYWKGVIETSRFRAKWCRSEAKRLVGAAK